MGFVRKISKKAYEIDAKDIVYNWNDDLSSHTRFKNIAMKTLENFPKWMIKQIEDIAEEGVAFLQVTFPNPKLLKD